jgi:ankyrin repeat protein
MYHCFRHGMFALEDIVTRLKFISRSQMFFRSAAWLFCYFAPEMEQFDPQLYDMFRDRLDRTADQRNVPSVFRPVIKQRERETLRANGWRLQRKHRKFFRNEETLIPRILEDDVDPLKVASQSPDFSTESRLKPTAFIPSTFLNSQPTLIHVAAFLGAVNCFRFLLANGAELHAVDNVGRTLPQFAVAGGNVDIIRECQRHGLDFFGTFHIAIQFHRHDIADWLRETILPDISSADLNGLTPLHVACRSNNLSEVVHLLELGADINCESYRGWTPLRMAVRGGHIECVNLLLSYNTCDIDRATRTGITPLHLAAKHGDVAIVRMLVANGANMRAKAINNLTPMMLAVANGHLLLVNYFRGFQNVDANDRNVFGYTALMKAVEGEFQLIARALIGDPRVNVNIRGRDSKSPLSIAIEGGMEGIAASLLTRPDLDVTAPGTKGRNCLHWAVNNGTVDIVRSILAYRQIDVNVADHHGNTPLHLACQIGSVAIVDLLLEEPGIDVNAVNAQGKTPLQIAVEFPEVAVRLIRNGRTDVNVRDAHGAMALHCFVDRVSHKCVQALCRREDVDVNVAQSGDGATALMIAAEGNDLEMVRILLGRPEVDRAPARRIAKEKGFGECERVLRKVGRGKWQRAKRILFGAFRRPKFAQGT